MSLGLLSKIAMSAWALESQATDLALRDARLHVFAGLPQSIRYVWYLGNARP